MSRSPLATLADELERTMRALRAWREPPPPLLPFRLPFAMDTMPFEHWLQLVLVPRMREIAASGEPMPARSNLAAHAVRELDGRDEMAPLIDVLYRIDELSPEPGARSGDGRRRAAAIGLAVGVVAWAFVALWGSQRLVAATTGLFPLTLAQSFRGSVAPGADFQPLAIMVSAIVRSDGATRATDVSLVLARSVATMTRGPTAPFTFNATEPPTTAAVLEWLADFGVDPRTDAARRAAEEAVAVVSDATDARSREALHDVPARAAGVVAEELLETPRRAPEWLEILVAMLALLAGAIPIAIVAVRAGLRRPRHSPSA